MQRSLLLVCVLAFLCPAFSFAQFHPGDREITLSGAGSNDRNGNNFAAGLSASVGYFATENIELSLRQTIAYSGVGDSSATTLTTHVAADLHIPLGRFDRIQLFLGAQGGYDYSDVTTDTFEAGPELGIKAFVNPTTFIFVAAEYDYAFNNVGGSEGQILYRVGIGFRF